jgi:hypothetical protein
MEALDRFHRSPLGRHPGLLLRKLAQRLGLYHLDVGTPPPPVSGVSYPAHWRPALREWTQQVPLPHSPHPFNRVFGLDFDEGRLLKMCRTGPSPGEAGLMGDIKLIWDYSRGQPLVTNAAAGPAQCDACAAFLKRWLAANADTNGPAWTCAMEVAIRAVNWIVADVLLEGELAARIGPKDWASWLWRHGYLVWRRLETRWITSNHYLSDLLGLVIIGAIFPEDRQARSWSAFAQREFPRALLAQTRADGGLEEASLRYHAFVTEMALLVRLAQGEPFPGAAEARLLQMCRIVAAFKDPTGDVYPFGDDDSGRVLALDFASSAGRAEILLRLASTVLNTEFPASTSAFCPQSGWWVRRAGDFAVALDFGGVGLRGLGAHAHNDDFSFCLDWRGQSVIVDPGTFLYTSDRAARDRFRSTLSHNTVEIDGREQRVLGADPFRLPGADDAFEAKAVGDDTWAFTRPAGSSLSHRREVSVCGDGVRIRDTIEGSGRHSLRWRFHFHPSVQPGPSPAGVTLAVPQTGALLLGSPSGVPLTIIPSEYSPGYGRCFPTAAAEAGGEFSLPLSIEWRIRAEDR